MYSQYRFSEVDKLQRPHFPPKGPRTIRHDITTYRPQTYIATCIHKYASHYVRVSLLTCTVSIIIAQLKLIYNNFKELRFLPIDCIDASCIFPIFFYSRKTFICSSKRDAMQPAASSRDAYICVRIYKLWWWCGRKWFCGELCLNRGGTCGVSAAMWKTWSRESRPYNQHASEQLMANTAHPLLLHTVFPFGKPLILIAKLGVAGFNIMRICVLVHICAYMDGLWLNAAVVVYRYRAIILRSVECEKAYNICNNDNSLIAKTLGLFKFVYKLYWNFTIKY